MQAPVKHPSVLALVLLIAAAASAARHAHASGAHHSLEDIRDTVSAFALAAHGSGTDVKVRSSALDPRLKLARCPVPLQPYWAPGSDSVGNTTVGVRCDGAKPWRLYVPVRVSKTALVVVTARTLTRGHRIGPGDLRLEERDLADVRGDVINDPGTVAGYVLRQATGADHVLSVRMLSAPLLVERGQRVHLLTSIPGLDIRMTGVALDDGARGDSVRVRNPVSNRVVQARVVQPGIVQMTAARLITN